MNSSDLSLRLEPQEVYLNCRHLHSNLSSSFLSHRLAVSVVVHCGGFDRCHIDERAYRTPSRCREFSFSQQKHGLSDTDTSDRQDCWDFPRSEHKQEAQLESATSACTSVRMCVCVCVH